MPFECPKCKSPVAREGQRFCYRCGQELNAYYDSLQIKVKDLVPSNAEIEQTKTAEAKQGAVDNPPRLPSSTVVLEANAFNSPPPEEPAAPKKATVTILLPTGDVFDRDLGGNETQVGKGPRNDLVIADPAVSTAHAVIKADAGVYSISDLGSRNGTFVNGEKVASPRELNHGDVIAVGLSKLTFRLGDHSETGAIPVEQLNPAKPVAPPPLTQESVADAVVNASLASRTDVDRLLTDGGNRRLCAALIEEGLISDEALRDLLSSTFQIPAVDLDNSAVDEKVLADFPPKLAREQQVLGFTRENDVLLVATADPTNSAATDNIKRQTGTDFNLRIAANSQLREMIDKYYGPRLIGVLPSGEKLDHPVNRHEVEIGKAPHNHIVLTDPTVSNTHAIILAREGGYSIVDLGSRNGTFVNSDRLGPQAHTLRHGDKIQLGQTVLTFRNPGETAANVTAVLSGEALEAIRRRAAQGETESSQPDASAPVVNPPVVTPVPPPVTATPPPVAIEPAQSSPADADEDSPDKKKKKKKKKKKEKDERVRAAYVSALGRVFAAVLSVALTVALTLYLTRSSSQTGEQLKISKKGHAKVKLPKASSGTPIAGGTFESSGIAQVPGTDGALFVDDAKLDQVFWMQIDSNGKQVGDVQAIPLGASIADMEGITYGDGYFYVTGSLSDPKDGDQNAIARFKFDTAGKTVKNIEVASGIRDFLISNVPELKAEGAKNGKDGGLNIEGIAWDPKRNRFVLGCRSPQAGGNALLIPLALQNPGGEFSTNNLKLAESRAIQLQLDGMGIRDIQYDSRLDAFLIISGAPEHHDKKLGFKLWEWNTDSGDSEPGLHALTDLDTTMKPEGITHFETGGHDFIFIVGDASAYVKLDYTETE